MVRNALAALLTVLLAGCATPNAEGFRDCDDCPVMAVAPGGAFVMGAPENEAGRFPEEGPQHTVRVAAFALSQAPITRGEYAAFVRATNRPDGAPCALMDNEGNWRETPGLSWRNPGFEQSDDHPVACVSWKDAQAYAAWLSARTGRAYRLSSEAEFEYAARAGAATTFPWGDKAGDVCARANGFDLAARRNHPDWNSLECDDGFATVRAIRGGSWLNGARGLRAAMRDRDPQHSPYANIGIRVARSL